MFSYLTVELLVVVMAALLTLVGLSLLALRRRNEILQDYLTPEEHDIEQEFFKKRPVREPPPKKEEPKPVEPTEVDPMSGATWGTPGEDGGTS